MRLKIEIDEKTLEMIEKSKKIFHEKTLSKTARHLIIYGFNKMFK
jgi:hypothetical protein